MTVRKKKPVKQALLLTCLLLTASQYVNAIDVWDLSGSDGNSGTDNELTHGSEQSHDLQNNAGVADQDWFSLGQAAYSSYEIIVDGLTEELASIPVSEANDALQVDLVDSGGTALVNSVNVSSIGSARSLRFRNTSASEVANQYVRVQSAVDGCTTTCTTNAEYRIRMRETTLMIPRFNNSGAQTTILIMQNGQRTSAVSATVRFWSTAGVLLASQAFVMPARGGFVLSTSTVPGASGVSGMMTVDHDGRFGEVTGKSVALEPSTGFSFDTPAVPRLF